MAKRKDDLDLFLRTYVSGYLLADLRSMERFRLPGNRKTGALGYPMVMTVAAGIELLGSLISPSKADGIKCFGRFWREWLYPNEPDRQRLADAVYLLGRHGIAHAFVAKPRITVTRVRSPKGYHLKRQFGTADTLMIDAPTLVRDFRRAYKAWRRRLRTDHAFRAGCIARLADIEAEARAQSASQTPALRKTPFAVRPLPEPRVFRGAHVDISSPSGQRSIASSVSVNLSTQSPKP
jgi:hypothetical protein